MIAKKFLPIIGLICLCSSYSSAQLLVSKVLGKNADKYGLGFGVFASLDIPLAMENQGIRIEVGELVYFPSKGQKFFTGTDGLGYGSIRVGYKYVLSESQAGFYLLPTVGYGGIVPIIGDEPEPKTYSGLAAAMEAGYSIPVGQYNQFINLGLKYENDFGSKGVHLQTLGFRVSYSFGLFRRERY